MNIVVCVKQAVDLQQIRIRKETREPVFENIPLTLGAIDKNALEEAVRLKDKTGGKVTAVSVGPETLEETIKEGLAMGADEAVLVTAPDLEGAETAKAALLLAGAIKQMEGVDLILLGEGSADNYSGQVTGRVAELLDLPQITYVRELQVEGSRVRATRDLEDALEMVEADCPVLVSATSELNTPRLPPLTAILKASKKPIATWSPAELGLDVAKIGTAAAMVTQLSNLAPLQERKQVLFSGEPDKAVDELVKALQKEGAL